MSAPAKDLALAEARRLQAIMRARGVECVIDLMPDSGGRWLEPMANRIAEMSHHIYSKRAHGLTRFYGFVRAGDPSRDLPGPLANGYGGLDEVYRIITLGRANHPGRGGPLTVAGSTIPRDNARPYTWGTEFEGGMDVADWTPSYRAFMANANAAILEWLGLPVEAHLEHSTWAPGRKSDRFGYTAAIGRLEIAKSNTASRPAPAPITPLDPTPTPDLPAPILTEDTMRIISCTTPWGSTAYAALTDSAGAEGLDDMWVQVYGPVYGPIVAVSWDHWNGLVARAWERNGRLVKALGGQVTETVEDAVERVLASATKG